MRKAFILIGMLTAFSTAGFADTSDWTGAAGTDYSTAANWDNGVPTDIAEFKSNGPQQTTLILSSDAALNQLLFDAGAPGYSIINSGKALSINGAGIVNNSSFQSQISFNSGSLLFNNAATAGNVIVNSTQGTIQFNNGSTAGNATINATTSVVQFNNASKAGTATIILLPEWEAGLGASISFLDGSSADNAVLVNNDTSIDLYGTATAGNATITDNFGSTNFHETSGAGTAAINNTGYGETNFMGTSNAGTAQIVNNAWSPFGGTIFTDASTASSATIVSNGGVTTFHDVSNAGNSSITNNNTTTNFFESANAGAATIINNGSSVVQFNNTSSAAEATITNNGSGLIQFTGTSTGGNAALNNNNGTVDISNLSSGMTVGSVDGSGTLMLGANSLTLGSNGRDTDISGVVSGTGGSLVKVGSGTLALAGSNTYSGGTQINGGAVAITDDSNLGDPSGTLGINNAMLITNAPVASARTITANNAAVIDTNGSNSMLNGVINGNGVLVKVGEGTLTLSGANTYNGGTVIGGGILQAGASNALPQGTSVLLANAPGVGLDLNGFNQSIGSLSGGGALGGNVILGTATLTTGSDNSSTLYAGSIAGSGTLVKVGTGTLVLAGANTFTGDTLVDSGNVDFIAAPPPTGTGTTASNTVNLQNLVNHGAVTPGTNGIGILKVANYSGSGALNISFNGSAHTSLTAAGNADLSGGTLNLIGSSFKTGQYSVVNAGSLSGTFAQVNTPASSYFLTFFTQYTPTDVEVLINALSFKDVAKTGNQVGVAGALDAAAPTATGDFASALRALQSLSSASDIQSAYTQISGDSLSSFQNAGLRGGTQFSELMHERSSASGFTTASLPSAPVQVAYAGDIRDLGSLSVSTVTASSSSGLWSRGVGYFDKTNADDSIGSPGSQATTGGFQTGYDFDCAQDVRCGFSAGYAKTSLTVDDRTSSGETTSVQSGIYTSYTPGSWFFNGSFAYTSSSNDMTRAIVFPGMNEQATADFQSRLYTTVGEAGYVFKPRKTFTVEPSVSLRQSHMQQDGFTESGAPGLDLTVGDQTTDSVVSDLGIRLTHLFFQKTAHRFMLGVRSAWEHELLAINNNLTAQFAEDTGGNVFTVQGTPRDRNAAVVGVDGRMDVTRSIQAFADYSATLSSAQNTEAIQGGLSLRW